MNVAPPYQPSRAGHTQIEMERHEAKYFVQRSQLPAIRDFLRPFCHPDPHARGYPPEYVVTTLQLDTHNLDLYRAKEHESLNRFKLRVRTYNTDGSCPIFMEVKRKIKGVIVKSRATVPPYLWGPEIVLDPTHRIPFKSRKEEVNYLTFVRLVKELGARPVMRIRYIRESYLSKFDNYARVTFDRALQYQPARTWEVLPEQGRWWSMDSATAHNRDSSCLIMELKTFNDAPLWMVEMAQRFDLTRAGICKYFTAVRMDSLFAGASYSDASENTSYD